MKISTVIMIFLTAILVSCSSSSKSMWPSGMTPFFAECEFEGVYTDKEYHKKKKAGGCKRGVFKYYDRGEPTLTND